MREILSAVMAHPAGEAEELVIADAEESSAVDTFGGKIFVRWDPEAAVTAFGPVSYFIDFLKTNGLWEPWVRECPLKYSSPNAPPKEDLLGTVFLAVLAGHKRYAHISTIRSDSVLPGLLGMKRVRSEDAVRRAFQHGEAEPYEEWRRKHLRVTYGELLNEPWILDMDATVKPLYGQQEQAVRGYNPTKPGRPSHVYHGYFLAALRLVLEVEVQPGNQTASQYAPPGLWAWLDRQARPHWPRLLRGDVSWGTERMLQEVEQRQWPYLFKLRQSPQVKKHIARIANQRDWQAAGGGWQGVTSELQRSGGSRARRVVVLRRLVRDTLAVTSSDPSAKQTVFAGMVELKQGCERYEYAVLLTSLSEEVLSLAQLYRDRAEAENIFDELKNQWGWTGFTTHDLQRCQILARINGLIYNWWSLYTRRAIPNRHTEATTSRPLLLQGGARQTEHAKQSPLTITSLHAHAPKVRQALAGVNQFLHRVRQTAEQLPQTDRWRAVLRFIFRDWLQNSAAPPHPGLLATG